MIFSLRTELRASLGDSDFRVLEVLSGVSTLDSRSVRESESHARRMSGFRRTGSFYERTGRAAIYY
jgi:hypothetical protein